jgi:hypothetical protein
LGTWVSDPIRLEKHDEVIEIQFKKNQQIWISRNCDYRLDDVDGLAIEDSTRIEMNRVTLDDKVIDVKVAYRSKSDKMVAENMIEGLSGPQVFSCKQIALSGAHPYTVSEDTLSIEGLFKAGETVVLRRDQMVRMEGEKK